MGEAKMAKACLGSETFIVIYFVLTISPARWQLLSALADSHKEEQVEAAMEHLQQHVKSLWL